MFAMLRLLNVTACTRNYNSNRLLLIRFGLLITSLTEQGGLSVFDALLYMIGDLTEATPREYEGAAFLASDFGRETGKQLGIGAVLGFFKYETLVEGIRKGSQKRKKQKTVLP